MMKLLLATLLAPFVLLDRLLAARHRLWAFARLRAALPYGLPASVLVHGCPELHGSRAIRIGGSALLYRELYLETQDQGSIEIGEQVVISRGVHIVSHAAVQIGRGSMIGEYASIRDANHRYGSEQALRSAGHVAQAIVIGTEVWIGRGAVVLSGVRIGDRAVIAANAVVTADVAAGVIVAGVPARPIKQGKSHA